MDETVVMELNRGDYLEDGKYMVILGERMNRGGVGWNDR